VYRKGRNSFVHKDGPAFGSKRKFDRAPYTVHIRGTPLQKKIRLKEKSGVSEQGGGKKGCQRSSARNTSWSDLLLLLNHQWAGRRKKIAKEKNYHGQQGLGPDE